MIGVYVFALSCFVGYHVIWGVTPALHTPLMAVTNAISAIVVVGAILVAGSGSAEAGLIEVIGFFAVFLAAINIFGGFVVTNRILAMFKKKK
jgi:H+-translocating NAD(P) transhydrogenase subunit alpha